MKRFSLFLLVFAAFSTKSLAQVDLVELRTAPIFGGKCIGQASFEIECPVAGMPTLVSTVASPLCGIDPTALGSAGSSCTVRPVKNINPLNGVSVFDLVLISKHLLGNTVFTSPAQWIAADVNKSGSISIADVVELRKLILGIIPNFQNNQSWRFVRPACLLGWPTANCGSTISMAQAFTADNNFIGIKIGDINGTADPENFDGQAAEDRSPDRPFSLAVADRFLQKGELFEARFELKNEDEKAVAAQFALEFEGFEITEVLGEKGLKPDLFGLFQQEKLLTSAWIEADGAPVFSLKMRAEKAGRLSEMLRLSDQKTRSEGYSSDGQPRLLRLDFETEKSGKDPLELFENRPNPFSDATEIRFFSPENEAVELSVFDAAGRLLFSKNVAAETGLNAVELTRNEVAASGFLLLKIRSKSGAAARWLN